MTVIAYIGNFSAPWCTEVHLARDLRALGHTVQEFQEPHPGEDKNRFLTAVETWCDENGPDMLMFTRTWGLPPEAIDLWRRLEENGTITCSYHLDLYVGLQREAGILDDPFWRTQYVFTPDGDPKSAKVFADAGINHHWLSPAVVSDECVPGKYRPEFAYDVVFVGSYGYHDEWPWRPQLIDHLAARYGSRFKRFGGDVAGGPIRGERLNDLYASARVVVGDSLHLQGHTNYWTDRYFETIGRGGFLIAPWIPGLNGFLIPGEHYVSYEHPDERAFPVASALEFLCRKIDYALDHPEECKRIRDAGQAHVREHHTYKHRLQQALDVMLRGVRGPIVGEVAPYHVIVDDRSLPYERFDDFVKLDPSAFIRVVLPKGHIDTPMRVAGTPSPEEIERRRAEWSVIMARSDRGPIDKLELGSGVNPTPGYTHLDINPDAPDVDIAGSAWPLNLADESVGEIRAVDVLEHLSYWDTPKILADWFRVLRPGGKIYIQVPDAETIIYWYVQEPERLVERVPANLPQTPMAGAAWRLLGGHHDGVYLDDADDFRWNAHYAMFSNKSLADALRDAGFEQIEITTNPHPNLLCNARKP